MMRAAAATIGATLTEQDDDTICGARASGVGVVSSVVGARNFAWIAFTCAASMIERANGIDAEDVMSAAGV